MAFFSLMTVVGLDFTTYRQLTSQEQVMTVSVKQIQARRFEIAIKSAGFEKLYQLEGDQWQIDFRLIRFTPLVALTGLSYLYQPARLSNRYESIEDQRSKPLMFYSLRDEEFVGLDLWEFFRRYDGIMPFIDTAFGSSVFMPLEDEAEYEILIGFSGLVVKAKNEPGKLALQNWQ